MNIEFDFLADKVWPGMIMAAVYLAAVFGEPGQIGKGGIGPVLVRAWGLVWNWVLSCSGRGCGRHCRAWADIPLPGPLQWNERRISFKEQDTWRNVHSAL